MDLTILANFSEIRQSEINLADLAIWRIFVTTCISGQTQVLLRKGKIVLYFLSLQNCHIDLC